MSAQKQIIDVREVLRTKAPNVLKRTPAFVVDYLIRTIHQDELNDILHRYAALEGVAFMNALVREFDLTLNLIGKENMPVDGGRYLFVSNHPLGGLDGICLAALLGERYGDNISCLVNDLLLFIPNLRSIFIPVNKHGAQSKEAVKRLDGIFASDRQVLTFPAGLCSRKQKGRICDMEWKKSFVRNAVKYRRDVVPVFFQGRNSNFFYRLANIRKCMGIGLNVEMLYLPDEMFRNKHQTFHVYIGERIPWQTFDHRKTTVEWAEWVKRKVYQLSQK